MKNVRVSLRTRLTLIYGSLFFAAGAVLVGVTYLLTARAVRAKFKVKVLYTSPEWGERPPDAQFFDMQKGVDEDIAQRQEEILEQMVQSSVLAMLVLGILAVIIGYLVAGRTLRPLQRVTATAQRLSESTLHERIGLAGPRDEIKELADTFDGMLDRLHRAFDSQRRFIANASHELRTPLAINRAVIEVAIAKPGAPDTTVVMGRKLLASTSRHERLIEGLLTLARSEREPRSRTAVDLPELAANAIDQLGERAGAMITRTLSAGAVMGDPVLLERCVINLVENAVNYNIEGGQVRVMTGQASGWAYVQVENTGPILSAEDITVIFEPFRRLRFDRVGSARGAGLGLSIVRAVVQAHGGVVQAAPRPGGGLVVALQLPAAVPSEECRTLVAESVLCPGRIGSS